MSVYFIMLSVSPDVVPRKQPVAGAESANASIGAGSFLGGVVACVVAALLVVGVLYGCWKWKHSRQNSFKVDAKEET